MGTHWEVTVWDAINRNAQHQLQADVLRASAAFDRTYSRFIPDSLVWRLSKQTGRVDVPEDLITMLRTYDALYLPSNKRLNPLVGFTLSDLGYDARYSLTQSTAVRSTPDLQKAVRILDDRTVDLREHVLIDVGALGKGFFIDRIGDMLRAAGCAHYLVNGSGDILYSGPNPIRVGLEDPADPSKAIGVLTISSGSVCASGTNRRAWRDMHHIIDPGTNLPTRGPVATWVACQQATYADALATALLLADPDPLHDVASFSYAIMNAQRKIKRSADFSAELFVRN